MSPAPRRRTLPLATAALAAALALVVGFGGGWVARQATTSSTTTTTSLPPPSSSSTSTTAPLADCTGGQLNGAVATSTGATGTIEVDVDVTNTGAACVLDGYPNVQLLGASGQRLTTTVLDGATTFTLPQADDPPARGVLAAGGTAKLAIQFSDIPVGTQTTCPTSTDVDVYPPGSTTPFLLSARLDPCDQGTLHVSPMFVPSG